MSESQRRPNLPAEIPQAKIKKRRRNFSVVWLVPLLAGVVAAYLMYGRLQEFGPKITISFKDAGGLKTEQTPVKYRGVQIGQVTAMELSADHQSALVKVRLQRSAASVAREHSVFWIVRPEVGSGNLANLGTVITGPEIAVLPGDGKEQSEFVGLENAPVALEEKGLKIVLIASRLGSLRPGSPVYYRGVEVGMIQQCDLSPNAGTVSIQTLIKQRYAKLVRSGSKFWNVSGIDVSVGLFRGLEINVESLRSLAVGGVTFATPDDVQSQAAKDGMAFPLYEKPAKEWLQWAPKIPIGVQKEAPAKTSQAKPIEDLTRGLTKTNPR